MQRDIRHNTTTCSQGLRTFIRWVDRPNTLLPCSTDTRRAREWVSISRTKNTHHWTRKKATTWSIHVYTQQSFKGKHSDERMGHRWRRRKEKKQSQWISCAVQFACSISADTPHGGVACARFHFIQMLPLKHTNNQNEQQNIITSYYKICKRNKSFDSLHHPLRARTFTMATRGNGTFYEWTKKIPKKCSVFIILMFSTFFLPLAVPPPPAATRPRSSNLLIFLVFPLNLQNNRRYDASELRRHHINTMKNGIQIPQN